MKIYSPLNFSVGIPIVIICLILMACTSPKIDFNAEIRPIFNEHCVSCHGGVKRSGGFGLVFRENALGKAKSGLFSIVAGNPEQSELLHRLRDHDPEIRMPQDEDPLSEGEIELIEKWIKQGAKWEDHWAYINPIIPPLPNEKTEWGHNEIDHFILAKTEARGLKSSPRAKKPLLLRRLYLDLIGLPPGPEEVRRFIADSSANAYEKEVDKLLASKHMGEHWGSMWLDLARYADSYGYSSDLDRVIWKYRDWVIKALNDDMPFDQFTREQLAGDLLANPSIDQLIATAFHRNSMTNGEGGADHEEFRNAAIIDRINTTWEIWQGTTLSCVQCHNHPYDPIKQTDFYSAFAFFNNTNDRNLISESPVLRQFEENTEAKLSDIKAWIESNSSSERANQTERLIRTHEPKIVPADIVESHKITFLNRVPDEHLEIIDSAHFKISNIDLRGIDRLYLNYRQYFPQQVRLDIYRQDLTGELIASTLLESTQGFEIIPVYLSSEIGVGDIIFRFYAQDDSYKGWLEGIIPGQKLLGEELVDHGGIQALVDSLMQAPVSLTTPIMVEKPNGFRRTTHLFERGNWLNPGEIVSPQIPHLFRKEEKAEQNRLDLANWLVSDSNPLSARVMVNRVWAQFFGRGIVATLEDFGTMGAEPSHPALLDWLAVHFREDQAWQLKKLMKLIVMSATYQQSAQADQMAMEKDPDNQWLARSPRVRLSAEQIRDQALKVSELLSSKMYGPSVMPVQPDGIWQVSFSNAKWKTSTGEDRYRRGIYTYMKRSAPYPSFVTFDAAGREVCLSRRIITNTPLQALVSLNDPVYIEAARKLAQKVISQDVRPDQQLSEAYALCMGWQPTPEKLTVLKTLYQETKEYYRVHEDEVAAIALSDDLELAVFTIVANSLMNMDEFLNKN